MTKIGRHSDQFPLRLPDGMRDRLKEEADRNRRSMNAEIVFHLERALFDPLGVPETSVTVELTPEQIRRLQYWDARGGGRSLGKCIRTFMRIGMELSEFFDRRDIDARDDPLQMNMPLELKWSMYQISNRSTRRRAEAMGLLARSYESPETEKGGARS